MNNFIDASVEQTQMEGDFFDMFCRWRVENFAVRFYNKTIRSDVR